MEHTTVTICGLADLELLRDLSIQTFSETYEQKNEPEQFQLHLDKKFNKAQLASELSSPESDFYFIKKGETVLGYLKLNEGTAQTEQLGPGYLEIERIYILQVFQGQGLGRLLIEKSIAIAQSKNKRKVWLGVWEENPKAIAFYQRMGFEVFGTHTFTVGDEAQQDFMMELAV